MNIVALQLDTLLHLPVFKTGALNHSATLPSCEVRYLSKSGSVKLAPLATELLLFCTLNVPESFLPLFYLGFFAARIAASTLAAASACMFGIRCE